VPAPVRIGLAGYGLGGRYFHAPLLASAAACEFLGVVTTSPERRRQVADELARPAFASLEELAEAGAEAVAISTPAATHVTLTHQALHLRLAVACESDVGSVVRVGPPPAPGVTLCGRALQRGQPAPTFGPRAVKS
jgi:hypothetical protein